jgi:hypothetical protein
VETSESIFNLPGKLSNPRQKWPAVPMHAWPTFAAFISFHARAGQTTRET